MKLKIIPHLKEAAPLVLPGTPVTFQRFTRRMHGWVGGYPQTNLFRLWRPQISPNIWMVGDSIFPGQSVAAVALGGIRVANAIIPGQKQGKVAGLQFNTRQNQDKLIYFLQLTGYFIIHNSPLGGYFEKQTIIHHLHHRLY